MSDEESESEEEEMMTPAQIMALRAKGGGAAAAAEEEIMDAATIRARLATLPGIPVLVGKEAFDYVDGRAVTMEEIDVYIEDFKQISAGQGEYSSAYPTTPAILFKYALDAMLDNAMKVVEHDDGLSSQIGISKALITVESVTPLARGAGDTRISLTELDARIDSIKEITTEMKSMAMAAPPSAAHTERVKQLLDGLESWVQGGFSAPLWDGAGAIAAWTQVMVLGTHPVTKDEVAGLRPGVSFADQISPWSPTVRAWLFRQGMSTKLEGICTMLAERSAGVRRQSKWVDMDTDLMLKAVEQDDVPTLHALVDAGADMNCTDASGATLLALATKTGKSQVVEYLQTRGASESLQSAQAQRGALVACSAADLAGLQSKKAAVLTTLTDAKATSVVSTAAAASAADVLLDAAADVLVEIDSRTAEGMVSSTDVAEAAALVADLAALLAGTYSAPAAPKSGEEEVKPAKEKSLARRPPPVGWLQLQAVQTSGKADLSKANDPGTQLLDAVETNDVERIKVLLDIGVPADTQGEGGDTALMAAVQNYHAAAASCLLSYGADINAANVDGTTAFHYACIFGATACLETLLRHGGCDTERRDGAGLTGRQVRQRSCF
eukprot:SAG22_NODE_1704_length_3775_cov_1.922470_2_plen_611_part_00